MSTITISHASGAAAVALLEPARPARLKSRGCGANLPLSRCNKNDVTAADDFGALIAAARSGGASALDRLLAPVPDLLWRILARFRTLARAEREDLVQDVFVTLLDRGLARFTGTTEHEWRAYLRRIAVNAAISHLRHEQFELPTDAWFARSEDDAGSDDPAEDAAHDEQLAGIARCIATLEPLDQQIFWMRMREYSYEEIVAALGIPQGTVASKFHRAQAKVTDCVRAAGFASASTEVTA